MINSNRVDKIFQRCLTKKGEKGKPGAINVTGITKDFDICLSERMLDYLKRKL